jgi:hypothetical protein
MWSLVKIKCVIFLLLDKSGREKLTEEFGRLPKKCIKFAFVVWSAAQPTLIASFCQSNQEWRGGGIHE